MEVLAKYIFQNNSSLRPFFLKRIIQIIQEHESTKFKKPNDMPYSFAYQSVQERTLKIVRGWNTALKARTKEEKLKRTKT